jgi:hypothetical protein
MKLTVKTIFIAFFLVCIFSLNAFSGYYELVGKWVRINGPDSWPLLGVALDEPTCQQLREALLTGDNFLFENKLKDYDIFRIKNHSGAMVIDVKIFDDKAKVMVFNGWYEQESGWIPLEWLDGNEVRPALKSFVKKAQGVHYPVNEPFQWYKTKQLY